MKKFTESLEQTNSKWSWTSKLEIDGFTDGRTREDAMSTIETYLKQRLGDKVKISSLDTHEELSKVEESYTYGMIKEYSVSIGIYAYTTGGIDFWRMLDSGNGSSIELAVDKNQPLDKKRPYLFKWLGDGPYAEPVDIEKIHWFL